MKYNFLLPAILVVLPCIQIATSADAAEKTGMTSASSLKRSAPTAMLPENVSNSANISRAEAHMIRKEYDQAEAIYREYLLKHADDLQVRLKLAEILSWAKKYDLSLTEYAHLLKARPDDAQLRRKYAMVLIWSGQFKVAADELRNALKVHPAKNSGELTLVPADGRISDLEARISLAEILSYTAETQHQAAHELRILLLAPAKDIKTVTRLADIAANIGYARTASQLYQKALELPDSGEQLSIRYAERMGWWGDFYGAEMMYRRVLKEHPGSLDAQRGLARLLTWSERYEEAEEVFQEILKVTPTGHTEQEGFALLKAQEKNFFASLAIIEQALEREPKSSEFLTLKAATLLQARRFAEARAAYRLLLEKDAAQSVALLGIAKTFIEERNATAALPFIEQATALEPDGIEAGFYRNLDRVADQHYVLEKLKLLSSPRQMEQLGRLYASSGYPGQAAVCYEAVIALDPEYFSARVELAGILAVMHRYDDSTRIYRQLAADFPGNSKILLGLARVLGWAKQYEESLRVYHQLELQNPFDPVPIKESARTALWAKHIDKATAQYDKLLSPQFTNKRINKGATLEREAKFLVLERRYIHALDKYDELLGFQPGNEEAIFERGQVACALGLCLEERASYEHLLAIDPLHSLAGEALARSLDRKRPSLITSQSYWEEKGRGELSRIARYKGALGMALPLVGSYNLNLAGNVWLETPTLRGSTYTAYGHTLGFDGVINRYLSGAAGWTRKSYDKSVLGVKDSGYATLAFNLNDYLTWSAGYERSDELYNDFGIRQGGIQSDSYWMAFTGNPLRNMTISAKGGYLRYNDSNEGRFALLSAGYAFSDHPRVFKIIANGEYRTINQQNFYIFNRNNKLIDITHPYWTPRDYLAESLTFEWNHDLSKFFFCGSRKHFYDLKATVGTDSEDNPSGRFEAEYVYEFDTQWRLALKGMIHRSQEWNSLGGWFEMGYRF